MRARILEIIRSPEFNPEMKALEGLSPKEAITPLFSFLCSPDEGLKWRAVGAMGILVARLAEEDLEAAREILRRLMWSLNHESGAIGWGAPEAMGEILARREDLAREFAHILMSYLREDGNFLGHVPLQHGVLWGVGRLARVRPELLRSLEADRWLLPYLESSDAQTRGLAASVLGWLGGPRSAGSLGGLLENEGQVSFYDGRRIVKKRVGELARAALARRR